MDVFMIVDRSGSMYNRWSEVLGTVQSYADSMKKKTHLTVVAFDHEIKAILTRETGKKRALVDAAFAEHGIAPRGSTALYDAIGAVMKVAGDSKKAQIIIITDGHENCSKELNRDAAFKIVDDWKGKGFDVVMIGADFNAEKSAADLGINAGATMQYNTKSGNVATGLAARSANYAATGKVEDFTPEQRAAAAGK